MRMRSILLMVMLGIVVAAPAAGQQAAAGRKTRKAAAKAQSPTLLTPAGEIEIFPADNPWNQDVSALPVHSKSREYLASIGLDKGLHPDFGTVWEGAPSGIPYALVAGDTSKVEVEFEYPDESDKGPYPIPDDPPIEGGANASLEGDRHILLIDYENRLLYELFHAVPSDGGWRAGSGAIFDLASNKLRPAGWTSADAAGLPIFPGLARYDEVMEKGEVRHALRFTVRRTRRAYVAPATHWASSSRDANLPPMGLRVRLKAGFDESGFPPPVQVILRGLKTYGMLLADNGGDWFISGVPDERWNDDELRAIKRVKGSDLEAVETGPLVTD